MTTDGRGLTEQEVERSRMEHGSNELTKKKREGFFHQFISNFGDPIIKILLASLAINLIFLFLATLIGTKRWESQSQFSSPPSCSTLSEHGERIGL